MKPITSTPDWTPLQTGEEDPLSGIANAPVASARKPVGSPSDSRVTDRIEVQSDGDCARGEQTDEGSSDSPAKPGPRQGEF